MSTTGTNWRNALVPLLLGGQMLAVSLATNGEHPPAIPAAESFPAAFGNWRLFRADPIEDEVARELRADRLVSQTYIETSAHSFSSLLVAWFQTQQGGARQPHSPKVCLPSGGWTPRIIDEITVETTAGAITVNRYIVDKNTQSAVVLYWYQTPRRVTAGEWAAKFWVAADAWRDRRTDAALVRVTTWPKSANDDEATNVATQFASSLYPALRAYLPK